MVPSHRPPLPGVRCKRWLGARPGTASHVASPCPHGVWKGRPMRRLCSRCPRVARVCVVLDVFCLGCLSSWMSSVLDVFCLGCPWSWMSFVLDALGLGCWPSWVSWDTQFASCTDFPLSWSSLAPLAPNVGPQAPPEAEATQERRL